MKKQNVQKHGWVYSGWEFSGGNSTGRNLIGGDFMGGSFQGWDFPDTECEVCWDISSKDITFNA